MIIEAFPSTAPAAARACVRLHGYGGASAASGAIYCLPAAGGVAPFFRSWPMLLPP